MYVQLHVLSQVALWLTPQAHNVLVHGTISISLGANVKPQLKRQPVQTRSMEAIPTEICQNWRSSQKIPGIIQ